MIKPTLDDNGRIYFWAEADNAVIHYCMYAHPEDGELIARDLHMEHSEAPEELWPYPSDVLVYLELEHYRITPDDDGDFSFWLSEILALFGFDDEYKPIDKAGARSQT